MATSTHIRTGLLRALMCSALLLPASAPASRLEQTALGTQLVTTSRPARTAPDAQLIKITYTTHNGHTRNAYVQLPHGYGPNSLKRLPLVISPHGRGVDGRINSRRWGNLPTLGDFAVVSPDGYGRRLSLHSWGYRGQIDDLARMADVVETALRWVHVDRSRIYAVGGSMGAQETLLLAGRYPGLLAGAVAVDGPVDFALQYRNFGRLPCDAACASRGWGQVGPARQRLARREIGGDPRTAAAKFVERSPLSYARQIAESCVPVQIWWSRTDETVLDSARQSGRMFRALQRLNPHAAIDEFVGDWAHTDAMRAETDLPRMLSHLGLLPPSFNVERLGATHVGTSPDGSCAG